MMDSDASETTSSTTSLSSVRYRRADMDHKLRNFNSLVSGLADGQIIILAEDSKDNNRIIAWAKIQPIGYAAIPDDDALAFEDDDNYNSNYYSKLQQREVVSSISDMIESDVNEQIWEEFEDDPTTIPNGLASLPWTKEYRAASEAAAKRRERREKMMDMEEQYARRNRPRVWELSLEKKSETNEDLIQEELLRTVLEEQSRQQYNDNDEIYVLTPLSLVPLFVQEEYGFIEVQQELIPKRISLKLLRCNIAAKLLGREQSFCLKKR